MLFHLLYPLSDQYAFFNVFRYITFRAAMAVVTAVLLALVLGPGFIRLLRRRAIGQSIRDVGPERHQDKAGTPTMGGVLILIAVVVPTLLWANLTNPFVWIAVAVTRLANGRDLPLPAPASAASAGVDLMAAVDAPLTLAPGGRAVIPTGLAIALPPGFEAQIRPRSGLAARNGVTVLNSPGTIDADYRGEIQVILHNTGETPFVVRRGERIAQLVISPVVRPVFEEVDDVDALGRTSRGAGGFGHTGV